MGSFLVVGTSRLEQYPSQNFPICLSSWLKQQHNYAPKNTMSQTHNSFGAATWLVKLNYRGSEGRGGNIVIAPAALHQFAHFPRVILDVVITQTPAAT